MTSWSTAEPTEPFAQPDIDPAFVIDWQVVDERLPPGQRFSTWRSIERLSRGPQPRPDWVVTDDEAIDTDLGVLKTGKEAEVFLLQRTSVKNPDRSAVMAAKRYRTEDHRDFQRSSGYTDGRRTRRTRDARALAKKSAYGRSVAAGQWAWAEWSFLKSFWEKGLPVPYPVQIDGTELLMELAVDDDGLPAPRIAQARADRDRLEGWWDQLHEAILLLSALGFAHGDLSAYNLLGAGDRLVMIDLPQAVDLAGNPAGLEFLHRDCLNVATWFLGRGLDVDGEHLFAEALAAAF